jgi:hypothetical protein
MPVGFEYDNAQSPDQLLLEERLRVRALVSDLLQFVLPRKAEKLSLALRRKTIPGTVPSCLM